MRVGALALRWFLLALYRQCLAQKGGNRPYSVKRGMITFVLPFSCPVSCPVSCRLHGNMRSADVQMPNLIPLNAVQVVATEISMRC